MRKLLVALVVLIALAAVADVVARSVAEDRIAARLATELRTTSDPAVDIGGWPFLYCVARGSIPSIEVSADGAGKGVLRLSNVTLELEDVTFSPAELASGETRAVRVGGGQGSATLTDRALTAALQRREESLEARFVGGALEVSSDVLNGRAAGDASIDGGELTVSAADGAISHTFPLPGIADGVRYTSVEIGTGSAVLRFEVEESDLGV
ncbi:MAG TPA: DUF2993 domain-containing protein [Actinomycetota bacterium]|nr:DUF2993 domain-containing protein [Actinomycetota bacterium]